MKKKILLKTLMPLGMVGIAIGIAIPITSCGRGDKDKPDNFNKLTLSKDTFSIEELQREDCSSSIVSGYNPSWKKYVFLTDNWNDNIHTYSDIMPKSLITCEVYAGSSISNLFFSGRVDATIGKHTLKGTVLPVDDLDEYFYLFMSICVEEDNDPITGPFIQFDITVTA